MKELIERMELESLNYYVFKHYYEELQRYKEECKNLSDNGQVYVTTPSYKKMCKIYEEIYGMIWGMYTVNYITDILRKKYISELLEIMSLY